MPPAPHKLDLYRQAVQHPQAEAAFLWRIYTHYHPAQSPTRLKEDFAGTAALAAAWVMMDENNRALAVERHAPTARWAQRRTQRELAARAADLHILCADVMAVTRPQVDIVAALNFSSFIYHDRPSLRAYFRTARRSLRPHGLFILDAYGGPGAWRVGHQTRHIRAHPGFDYIWEQHACDLVSSRVDCRIHFQLGPAFNHRLIRSAFHYDWRLWSLPELTQLMTEAGFTHSEIWCDRLLPPTKHHPPSSDGVYRPIKKMEPREDWIAYVVGLRNAR